MLDLWLHAHVPRCLLTRRRRARARLAVQVAYDARLPFGVDGYRADCRDYVFSEVLYARHLDEAAPSSPYLSARTSYTSFQAVGRSPTTLSAGSWLEGSAADGEEGGGDGWGGGRGGIYKDGEAWLGGVAGDVYGRYQWQVRGSEEEWEWGGVGRNPEELAKEGGYRAEVQLNVCANSGAAVGLFFSGVVPGGGCSEGFKTCADTCGDSSSAHYRHAAPGDGGGRGGGASGMCDAGSLLAEPVGLRSRALVLDSALSASSARSSNESAAQARLHGAGFWRAASAGREEFLQVTLPAEEAHVIALAVQGGGGSWLSSFKLAVTRLADEASQCRGAALPDDPAGAVGDAREVCAKAWTMVSDADGEHVVYSVETYDGDSVVLVSLTSQQRPAGLRAKRLRIYPVAWGGAAGGGGGGGGLRVEVYRGVCSGAARAGVSVGETPMLAPRPQLVSVGLRHAQRSCAAGWSGDGVECGCPAEAYVGVLAYWRFESVHTVSSPYWHVVDSVVCVCMLVWRARTCPPVCVSVCLSRLLARACQRARAPPLPLTSPPSHSSMNDVCEQASAHALGTPWYTQWGLTNPRNDLELAFRGAAPTTQVFIRPASRSAGTGPGASGSPAAPTRVGPRNIPFAVLCVANLGHLALPGAGGERGALHGQPWGPFLQTMPGAAINGFNLTSFTIEATVYLDRRSVDSGQACVLERPDAASSTSAACPSFRLAVTPSNRVLATWSNTQNASQSAPPAHAPAAATGANSTHVWSLAGRTALEEHEWHRIVLVGDAAAHAGKGECTLYLFRARDRAWRQEARISPCSPALSTPSPPPRWLVGACIDGGQHADFWPGFLDEIRVSFVALPQHRWLWLP